MIVTYLEQLKNIKADIVIDKFGVEASEIGIVHVFEYKAGRFALHMYELILSSFKT